MDSFVDVSFRLLMLSAFLGCPSSWAPDESQARQQTLAEGKCEGRILGKLSAYRDNGTRFEGPMGTGRFAVYTGQLVAGNAPVPTDTDDAGNFEVTVELDAKTRSWRGDLKFQAHPIIARGANLALEDGVSSFAFRRASVSGCGNSVSLGTIELRKTIEPAVNIANYQWARTFVDSTVISNLTDGSIFALFGSQLAPKTESARDVQKLPLSLGGIRVGVASVSIPADYVRLYYVSPTLIVGVLPEASTPAGYRSLMVWDELKDGSMAPRTGRAIFTTRTSISLFTQDGTGTGAANVFDEVAQQWVTTEQPWERRREDQRPDTLRFLVSGLGTEVFMGNDRSHRSLYAKFIGRKTDAEGRVTYTETRLGADPSTPKGTSLSVDGVVYAGPTRDRSSVGMQEIVLEIPDDFEFPETDVPGRMGIRFCTNKEYGFVEYCSWIQGSLEDSHIPNLTHQEKGLDDTVWLPIR